jgi:membrane protease YdiL (CAAX protease family)
MKLKLIVFQLVVLQNILYSQSPDTSNSHATHFFPNWTLFVPGATYYYDGRVIEGLMFNSIELSTIMIGIKYDQSLRNGRSSAYYNYPFLLGMQTFSVEKCDWIRNKLEWFKYKNPEFQYDPISEKDLFLAPFRTSNIFTSITAGMAGLAFLELWLNSRNVNKHFGDVQQIYFLNQYIERDHALAAFSTISLASSWSAGVSEEYMMRNGLMPLLDYKFGQSKGLIYSSLGFGLFHFPNVFFADKPDYGQAIEQVIVTSIIGYILGLDVQNRGYQIGPAVAAHAWYDFILMVGSFITDPENNVFAVQIKFNMD